MLRRAKATCFYNPNLTRKKKVDDCVSLMSVGGGDDEILLH